MATTTATKEAVRAALAPIAADMAEVERVIAEEMSSSVARVQEIGRYITQAGGKRMRPALLILMARAMGEKTKAAPFLGAVIEILHTATLMHDDVVDEGMMRRGRETANARWGNGPAVLVGDFLYTRSFAVIERKTACLFEAAAHMAAALADAPKAYEDACAQYALCLGNAFQIADDILDYKGVAADIGKNLGADLREGKVTLPVIYALQATSDADKGMIRAAIRAGDGDFEAISRIVVETGAIEKCHARALEEAKKGVEALNSLPAGQFRESLIKFLSFAAERYR